MPKFKVEIIEKVTATIEVEVEADDAAEAKKEAVAKWVRTGDGKQYESVDERWVENIEEERNA